MYDFMLRLLRFIVAIVIVIFNFFRGLPGIFEKPDPTNPSTETTVIESTTEYTTERTTEHTTENTTEHTTENTTEHTTEHTTENTTEHTTEHTTEPAETTTQESEPSSTEPAESTTQESESSSTEPAESTTQESESSSTEPAETTTQESEPSSTEPAESTTQESELSSTEPVESTTRIPVTYTDKSTTEGGTLVRTINHRGMKMLGGRGVDIFNGTDADIESIYACGTTTSNDGDMIGNTGTSADNKGSFIVKYDSAQNIKWKKLFSEADGAVIISDVAILKDKSVIAVGYSNATVYSNDEEYVQPVNNQGELIFTYEGIIFKLSPNGDVLWKKSFGGSGFDKFNCVCAVGNGFAVGGSVESADGSFSGVPEYGISSAILMNFDENGNILWNRYLNGKNGASIEGISSDNENNVFVSCLTGSVDGDFEAVSGLFGGYLDTVVLKYDYYGTNKWHLAIASSGRDEFDAITADGEGGCVVGGHYQKIGTAMPDGSFADIHNCGAIDALVFRINPNGTVRWSKVIAGLEDDFIYDIAKLQGGYAAVGASYSSNRDFSGCNNFGETDGFVAFLTPGGKTVDILTQGGSREDSATCISVSGGDAFVFGKSVSNDGYFDGCNTHLTEGMIELFGNYYTGYVSKYAYRVY